MSNSVNTDLLTEFKKLLAANKSQEARLEEYATILNSRNTEIEMLQAMLSEATAHRSSMDNDSRELKDLQQYLQNIQQRSGALYPPNGAMHQHPEVSDNATQQFRRLQLEYTYLQSQVTDLQAQLSEMNHRNTVLQQQNSRVAELESLLENTKQEISLLSKHFSQSK